MFSIKIFGEDTEKTVDSDGLVLVSALGSNHITLNCSFINYEPFKVSERREIAGATFVDDGMYRYVMNITTERIVLKDFGTYINSLLPILKKSYLYVQVLNYSFDPFSNTKAMPFIVNDFSVNWSAGYKWLTMNLEKSNGTT